MGQRGITSHAMSESAEQVTNQQVTKQGLGEAHICDPESLFEAQKPYIR